MDAGCGVLSELDFRWAEPGGIELSLSLVPFPFPNVLGPAVALLLLCVLWAALAAQDAAGSWRALGVLHRETRDRIAGAPFEVAQGASELLGKQRGRLLAGAAWDAATLALAFTAAVVLIDYHARWPALAGALSAE